MLCIMDILIRIILMIGCGILIPYIGRWLYGPLIEVNFKELEKSELISQAFLYVFIFNWFIIVPSIIFVDCIKYIADIF